MTETAAEIQSGYFRWLCDQVDIDGTITGRDSEYWNLASVLHRITFTSTDPRDENRAEDGMYLRREYTRYTSVIGEQCTVLEMMVALARRMSDIMFDPNTDNTVWYWFMELLQNLGLDAFTDDDITNTSTFQITTIVETMMKRTYKRNGEGGLFPLRKSRRDQRKIEIWYQMNAYLEENYTLK